MAFYIFKIKHFPFPKPLILFCLFMVTSFFSPLRQFTSALSFNFTSFNPGDSNITYETALAEDSAIQLTDISFLDRSEVVGRATYSSPMHLWDKASGNLTDFTTHFTFAIYSQNGNSVNSIGGGLAFFLAPHGSKIPNNVNQGAGLGLARDDQLLNSTDNPFVAVEFDIYSDQPWDSPGEHVGIDINSMKSIAYRDDSYFLDGNSIEAWINYNSSSHNLNVQLRPYDDLPWKSLSYNVDLRHYLPEWVTFGFSAATGNASIMHAIRTWNFSSTLEDNVAKPTVAGSPSPNSAPDRRKNKRLGLSVGLGGGGSFLLGGFALILFGFWKRNKRETEEHLAFDRSMDDEFQRETGPNKFSFNELAHATNNFNDEEKLGQGGFGGVYKGFLRESNSFVAVKRVSKGSKQGMKEYASEVKIISRLRHRNLVQLIGWCHERGELLLVYEFMPNGSLDSHLFTEKILLIWAIRYKVAQGLASALLYLHEEWEQCVVHRDIKSSNIMLDSNFNTKLGDFGLARLVDHVKGSQTTVLAGTMGYMAPECVTTGKASKESDVYSFGIVALEIACGRKPIKINALEDQVVMVEWVRKLYGIGKVLEAADPRLGGDFHEPQMERLMIVGLWCSHPNRNLRPSIREAIHVLNFEAPLPILPSNMPGTAHLAPVVNRPTSMSLSMSNIASDYGGR
ncbi:L-type lectin-domain containing receptor kinase IX.1-like [Corylus avellana]|uniref:L-type lectin-domain containing receptor kinase IX.1-like n=1 Tax=Corylus avellana TaxID=13451 RepID=UPI00286CBF28|nr:L-type lectin-domain containing receptor kinase IX.1-like [Corylus avellana]